MAIWVVVAAVAGGDEWAQASLVRVVMGMREVSPLSSRVHLPGDAGAVPVDSLLRAVYHAPLARGDRLSAAMAAAVVHSPSTTSPERGEERDEPYSKKHPPFFSVNLSLDTLFLGE